jgi:hypothetical protein
MTVLTENATTALDLLADEYPVEVKRARHCGTKINVAGQGSSAPADPTSLDSESSARAMSPSASCVLVCGCEGGGGGLNGGFNATIYKNLNKGEKRNP